MGDVKVAIRLPEQFREDVGDDGLRLLEKALYGLPISPRLWGKTLNRDLAGCASYSHESKWCLPPLYRYHVSHFLLTGVPATNAKNGGARHYEHSAPPGVYQERKSKGEF